MAMRGGQYSNVAKTFLRGGTGQLGDKKEMAEAAIKRKEREKRESELDEDYKRVVEKIQEYTKKQKDAENRFYAMKEYIDDRGFPMTFLKNQYSLSEWLELNGVGEDVQSFWDQHYEDFADVYEYYADQEQIEKNNIEEKRRQAKESMAVRPEEFVEDLSYEN